MLQSVVCLENGEIRGNATTCRNVSEPLFIKEKDAYIYVPFINS